MLFEQMLLRANVTQPSLTSFRFFVCLISYTIFSFILRELNSFFPSIHYVDNNLISIKIREN